MTEHWKEGDAPAWYKLRLEDDATFSIRIHRMAHEEVWHHLEPDSFLVKERRKEQPELSSFQVSRRDPLLGFGGVLRQVSNKKDEWVTYQGSLPTSLRGNDAANLVATLRVLFGALYVFEDVTEVKHSQFLVIRRMGNVGTAQERDVLQVVLTPTACRYVDEWEHTPWPGVRTTMLAAVRRMRPQSAGDRHNYTITKIGRGIEISLPDRARLATDEGFSGSGAGICILSSREVHETWQQLALFMGLCRLQEAARRNSTETSAIAHP